MPYGFPAHSNHATVRRGAWLRCALLVAAAVAVVEAATGCTPSSVELPMPPSGQPVPLARVRLGDDRAKATVAVAGAYQIYELPTRRLLFAGDPLPASVFTATSDGLILNGQAVGGAGVVLVPAREGTISVDDRSAGPLSRYRGNLRVFAVAGKVRLVNVLDVEAYLPAVVGSEMPHSWALEALKAQAVAARSYVLFHMKYAVGREWDVWDDERSQAYKGLDAETENTRLAVSGTRGVVLVWDDRGTRRVMEALYHSTCGGRTVAVEAYFPNASPMRPLSGVECPWCTFSKHCEWTTEIAADELASRLRRDVPACRDLKRIDGVSVAPADRTSDGRAQVVTITSGDRRWSVDALSFRRAFLPEQRVRSDRFEATLDHGRVVLSGRGFGHGVGLCQYGAQGQARQGRTAAGILNFYYPGAELVRVY